MATILRSLCAPSIARCTNAVAVGIARPATTSLAPRVAVAVRPFSISAIRAGDPKAPKLYGSGAVAGEVPTDEQQATGLERFELLGKAEGIDLFDMTPLDSSRKGTMENPIELLSYYPMRHAGCTGSPVDSHELVWIQVTADRKHNRCPECGSVYTLRYIPHASLEGEGEHH